MKRDLLPSFVIVAVLAALSGIAWLTWHPDSPWLERAQDWPVVGGLAQRFRVAYLGETARVDGPSESAALEGSADGTGGSEAGGRTPISPPRRRPGKTEIARRPTAPSEMPDPPPRLPRERDEAAGDGPSPAASYHRDIAPPPLPRVPYRAIAWGWYLPGERILASAEERATVLAQLNSMAYLPVLDRLGVWEEVLYGGRRGWIDGAKETPRPGPRARRGLLRHRSEPVRGSDRQRLKRAQKILGVDRPSRQLGPYQLFTDVEDEEILAFLDLASSSAEEAYTARYGRVPSGDPKRSIVLFARHADYLEYSESAELPSAAVYSGHAGRGVLAFFVEGRPLDDLAGTMVHEITHLLNDRALAGRLPPWLEEGLATDMGSLWVESLDVEGARRLRRIPAYTSRLVRLGRQAAADQLPDLAGLMALDRESFYRADFQSLPYAHAVAFVRYLLDGEGGRHREAFRTFLGRVAAGRQPEARLLLKLLDTEAGELDAAFRTWLRAEVESLEHR